MSDLGPMTFGKKEEYVFLGKELHEDRNYSESTATKIDEQIALFLAGAQAKAEQILAKHNDKFELIAQTLIKKETIGQAEFKALMDDKEEPTPENQTTIETSPQDSSPKTRPAPAAA